MSEEVEKEEPIEITSPYTYEEKEAFYKSVLSDKSFTSQYKLFDDKMVIEFRNLTVEESNDVFFQLKKDQVENRFTSDASYLLALTSYRLALSIISINGEPFQPEITKKDYKPSSETDSYIHARAKIFDNWPVFKLSAIAEIFKSFEDKIMDFTKEIQNKNFWIAAE